MRLRFLCVTCFCGSPPPDDGDNVPSGHQRPREPTLDVRHAFIALFSPSDFTALAFLPYIHFGPQRGASPSTATSTSLVEQDPEPPHPRISTIQGQILLESPCMMLAVSGDGSRVLYQNDLSIAFFGDLLQMDNDMALKCSSSARPPQIGPRGFAVLQELFSFEGLETLQVREEISGMGLAMHAWACNETAFRSF